MQLNFAKKAAIKYSRKIETSKWLILRPKCKKKKKNYSPKVGLKSIFSHVGKWPDFYACSFRAWDPVKYLAMRAVRALHAKEQFPEEVPTLEANNKLSKHTAGSCHASPVSSRDRRMCPYIINVRSVLNCPWRHTRATPGCSALLNFECLFKSWSGDLGL